MSDFIVTTERLVIRQIEDGDQDLVYNLLQESAFLSGLSKADEYTKIYRKVCWDEINCPNTYNGMIFLKDNGAFIGKVCMQHTDRDLPELGIDVMRVHQNHGYGPEAIIAFCNWYSAAFGLAEVKVRISEDNAHSIHVFEKLGAEYDKATSYLSKDVLNMLKEKLADADLSVLSQESVRDYLLRLPVLSDKYNSKRVCQ